MDALTATEIFALRRAAQQVGLDDLRTAQARRIRPSTTTVAQPVPAAAMVAEYAA